MEYLKGASSSFDSLLASGNIKLNKETAEKLLKYVIKESKKESENQELFLKFISRFISRFRSCLDHV